MTIIIDLDYLDVERFGQAHNRPVGPLEAMAGLKQAREALQPRVDDELRDEMLSKALDFARARMVRVGKIRPDEEATK
jgi:hypothetical protein